MKLMSCDAVDRPIRKGWVHLDLGAKYKRYTSDINRGIFLGRRPTAEEERFYACRLGVSELMDRMIKPGVCIDDVVKAAAEYVRDRGYVLLDIGGSPFIGHGIGLEPYQRPNIVLSVVQPEVQDPDGKVRFEAGMMFSYEMSIEKPGMVLPFFNIEDNVVVSETGVENMSGSLSRELRVKV
ncbi:MAG: M24 family metallopeptidase [Firmicutes bacterium]|nr:M24 family metallopeptidase [Bacillota bacterium]